MQICKRCNSEKELTYFSKNKKSKTGHINSCKECMKVVKREAYLNRTTEQVVAARAKIKANYEENKSALLEQSKEYYKNNKEKVLSTVKKYNDKNKESRNTYARDRVEESRLVQREYRKRNKDKVFATSKKWRNSNRDKLRVNAIRRKARKLQAIPKWTKDCEWEEFFISEIYHLSKISSEMLRVKFNVDHIVPLNSENVCGLHYSCNLQIMEWKANISKGNRWWPDMW